MGERRPDELLKERVINLLGRGTLVEPVGIEIRFRRGTADEVSLPFRPYISARGIDEQRAILDWSLAREGEDVAALGLDRDLEPGHGGDRPSAGAGAVDERAAGNPRAVLEADGHDGAAVPLDLGHL